MIGGYLRSTSSLAMIAAAGFVMGSVSAQAADLGGNCCADLEERVAELEATTVRKGNRKVSLQIYGNVSQTIMWWNDGAESNVFVQENQLTRNLLGFQGSAKITSDWSAGFKLEMQFRGYRSSVANQLALGASNNVTINAFGTQSLNLRHVYWYLKSETYGTVTVGRDNDAAAGTSAISLVNPDGFSGPSGPGFANSGFFLRRSGTTGNNGLSTLTWGTGAYVKNGDGPAAFDYAQTSPLVKYTSPFFFGQTKTSGFQVQANWGADDAWAVALRYVEDFGTFRFAAGASWSDWRAPDRTECSTGRGLAAQTNADPRLAGGSTIDCNAWQASASILHVPSGLYVSGGGAQGTDHNADVFAGLNSTPQIPLRRRVDDNFGFWWVQAGWQAKLNPLGNTIFWAQYEEMNTGLGVQSNVIQTISATDPLNSLGATAWLAGNNSRIWSFGVSQEITAAAMMLYAGFHNYSNTITLMNPNPQGQIQTRKSNPIDDMQLFYTGATIRF